MLLGLRPRHRALAAACSLCGAGQAWAGAEVLPGLRMDPRFELLGVVSLLAGADERFAGFYRRDIPYVREAERRFRRLARHPVVGRFSRLSEQGLTYIQAYEFIHRLSDPPELELRGWVPGPLAGVMGGPEGAEELRLLLADFARTSRFMDFYQEAAPERERLLEAYRSRAPALRCRERLEAYTGMPIGLGYTLIVSPFAEPAFSSVFSRRDSDGALRLESVLGVEIPAAEKPGLWFDTRAPQIWREILHHQLLALAEPFRERLEQSRALYDPIAGACPGSWYECAQLHIAFAVADRLMDIHVDPEAAAEWPVKYARIGLPYLEPLILRLREYESRRPRYPTLMHFYPRLVEALEEEALKPRRKPPFLGGISSVMASSGSVVLILPTREGRELAERLRAGAEGLRSRLWPEAELLTDREALSAELGGRTLVVLGSPRGNRWLSRNYARLNLPVKLSRRGISLARRPNDQGTYDYKGDRLGLISVALNPVDPSRAVLLYAAWNPETLPGLLDLYRGPADFVITQAGSLLRVGLYEKSRLPWRVK